MTEEERWSSHQGEDYTVVMVADEVTDNASIGVHTGDRDADAALARRLAALLNRSGRTGANEPNSNRPSFTRELAALINRHGLESISNTPDFILAQLLTDCLFAFDFAARAREKYYGRNPNLGPGETAPAVDDESAAAQ